MSGTRHEVSQGADPTGYGYRATCTCGWTATGASLDSVETAGDAHRAAVAGARPDDELEAALDADNPDTSEAELPDADTAAAEYEATKRRVIAGTASATEARGFVESLECAVPHTGQDAA